MCVDGEPRDVPPRHVEQLRGGHPFQARVRGEVVVPPRKVRPPDHTSRARSTCYNMFAVDRVKDGGRGSGRERSSLEKGWRQHVTLCVCSKRHV